jgi:hypothetical protein
MRCARVALGGIGLPKCQALFIVISRQVQIEVILPAAGAQCNNRA